MDKPEIARRLPRPAPSLLHQATLRTLRDLAARRLGGARRAEDRPQDLLGWGRRYLVEHFRQRPSRMHEWLAEQLDRMPRQRGVKVNVLGPRGSAKSTIGSLAYPLRAALEGWEAYTWIVSDTWHQARAHLENIKAELEHNVLLAQDYPRASGRGTVWRAGLIVLANGMAIEAIGTGQRIRGRRWRAHRPTFIVCDDLQNDAHMRSALQRERSRQWFFGALTKAGTRRTNLLSLATALHHDALAMQLARTPGWNSRIFRAVETWPAQMSLWKEWEAIYTDLSRPDYRSAARAFYDQRRPDMDAGAVLLWPEEEDLYALMCMRAEEGEATFAREKQNSPVNPERCEWPEAYFDEGIWFEQWPHRLQVRSMALDPSKGGDARRGDFSAIVVLGVDECGLLYVDADLARRDTAQIVADAAEWYRRFGPDVFGLEANQFQELLGAEIESEFRRQGILGARPWPLQNTVNKLVRIRRLGPYLASRRLRFRQRSPGAALLVEQLKEFPLNDHDDGPDALEMALRLAIQATAAEPDDGLGSRLAFD